MALTGGTRLGPYEILAPIGAGGMGEVYRARDTRLDRSVAIKVLPPELSSDPDRRARFEREARTVASLVHPHICTLYDVGDHGGSLFLVMELLEGETLAGRLRNGPLPIDQATAIAVDIAEGLSAAHRQGVIHRDLKPGNVMVTRSGAKLLDFGLAKLARDGEPAAAGAVSSVTHALSLTAEGVIVGTLPYMAPEQVEGKPIDARTDLWALGVILYEMVTGNRPFDGGSAASLIAAILERDVAPLGAVQTLTPPTLDRLVRRCLAKAPEDRPDTAHDVALQLGWLKESGSGVTRSDTHALRRHVAVVVAAALGAAIAGAGLTWWLQMPTVNPAGRARFEIVLPEGDVFEGASGIAIAPDGSRVAYIAVRNGVRQLFLRSMDRLDAVPLPGTEIAAAPFFSPDGQWIGFFTGSALMKVSVGGGAPTVICDGVGYRRGATWMTDDEIVFAAQPDGGLRRVNASGGAPAPLTAAAAHENHKWPDALPGGRVVAFTIAPTPEDVSTMEMAVFDLDSRRERKLGRGTYPRFVGSDRLVFVRDGALWTVGFDSVRLQTTGDPVRLEETPRTYVGGLAEVGVGRNGTLVLRPSADYAGQLTWVDRTNRMSPISDRAGFTDPTISPDGRRIASLTADGLWLYDIDRDTWTPLLSTRIALGSAQRPAWSPDGRQLMLALSRKLHVVSADGDRPPEPLTPENESVVHGVWLSDGVSRVVSRQTRASGFDVWLQRPDGTAVPIVATPETDDFPAFSPDERWLAFLSGSPSAGAVYVQRYPAGTRLRLSPGVGGPPRWARNGRELFYITKHGEMVAVAVDPDSETVFGRPTVLFRGSFEQAFDVEGNGSRFVVAMRPTVWRLIVTLNAFEGPRERQTAAGR